jgi:isochorismate synthase
VSLPGLSEAGAGHPLALSDRVRERLAERVHRAATAARRSGHPVLASVTTRVSAALDPSALLLRGRRGADELVVLEQPAGAGHAVGGLGRAAEVRLGGPERFHRASTRCGALARGALTDDPAGDRAAPRGAGPVWLGGFSFAPEGGSAPEWSSLGPSRLVLPELGLAREGAEARMTLSALISPDDDPDAAVERLERRAGEVASASMPLLDPDPVGAPRVAGAAPPEHYEEAVARAVERIAAGELSKVVLAREVRVHHRRPIDPAPVFGALREAFPECYCYLVSTPEATFLGASPELLVRRDGARAQTVALAGTERRSADPAVDAHLGERLRGSEKNREEHAIVARRIERALEPVSLWVTAAEAPALVRVQNVQHLATPIRAQLSEPTPVLELAGLLHPTPAVGGEPADRAEKLIPALEGLDRGWYAGPVGWSDLDGDGELCVALRCALLRGAVAHLYAGAGVVADSVPAEELAETEIKLAALLPLLS